MKYLVQHSVRKHDDIGPWKTTEKIIEADNKLEATRVQYDRLVSFGYQTAEGKATLIRADN